MTDAYFYPRWAEQEGWTQDSTQTYKNEYFGGLVLDPGRHIITRFFDVDLPAGATITAAYVVYYIYAKNDGDAQNFTYNFHYEATAVDGTTVRQDCTPLRQGVNEHLTASRTWGAAMYMGSTFNWNIPLGDNQPLQVNVTSAIQQAYGDNNGRHMNLAFKMSIITESGDMGIGNDANGYSQRLLVQYTDGTPRTKEVVNVNENANFVLTEAGAGNSAAGAPAFWFNNTVFGVYQDNPTYSTASSHAGIPATPYSFDILKVTSTETGKDAVAWMRPPNDLAWGEWYCFSFFVYVPTGVTDVKITSTYNGLFLDTNRVRTKDAWTRVYTPVLINPDRDPRLGCGSTDGMNSGQSFYFGGVNFTRGRQLYPYFDGNFADSATYQRNFDWGGGTTGTRNGGVSYASWNSTPAVTTVTQPSVSTHKRFNSYWTYTDPLGESGQRHRVEIRKKRVP